MVLYFKAEPLMFKRFIKFVAGGDVVKITQLSSSGAAQGKIAQPKTPVTLQFQGNTFTLSQSQLRQLTAGQPLQLQGNSISETRQSKFGWDLLCMKFRKPDDIWFCYLDCENL